MGPAAAVKPAPGGFLLAVEVHAAAERDAFPAGFDAWRNRVRASVRERAEKGRANRRVLDLVARFFGLEPGAVSLQRGARQAQKTVRVRGLEPSEGARRLEEALA